METVVAQEPIRTSEPVTEAGYRANGTNGHVFGFAQSSAQVGEVVAVIRAGIIVGMKASVA